MGRAVVAALDRSERSRFGRGATAAAITGALVPDVDLVLMPAGWDIYLRVHQVGTHSIAGACALGCVAGFGLHALIRARHRQIQNPRSLVRDHRGNALRSGPVERGSRPWALAAAASLGAMSHLLLDLLSGAALQLGWPMAHRQIPLPLVAMAEPWLLALFVAGALWMWRARTPRRIAVVVLVAVAALLGIKAALYGHLLRVVAANPRITSSSLRAIEARWGSWTEWDVFVRDAETLRVWRANVRTGTFVPLLIKPIEKESPLVVRSRSLDTVRNFLSIHALGFAIERPQGADQVEVLWSDVRYCRPELPGASGIDCAVWFGGLFDKDGQAITQVVHVGGWIQRRPLSR